MNDTARLIENSRKRLMRLLKLICEIEEIAKMGRLR